MRLVMAVAISALLEIPVCASSQTLGVPNEGNSPPTGSPVQIEDCTTGARGGALVAESNREFKIVFTNEGRLVADLVRFRIDYGTEQLTIRDVGKFTPGVTVTHVYRRRGGNVFSSPLFAPVKLSCSVAAIHFTDGTEWTPGAATANAVRSSIGMPAAGSGFLGIRLQQSAEGLVIGLM